MELIDLRSDTVTQPSPGMRAAMAAAEVGDDQYGEDPSVNALQERVAGLLGKEAALWMASGTMAEQVALRTLTRPGDDVIAPRESHLVWHEAGASGANAGVQFTEIGGHGLFTADNVAAAAKPRDHIVYPPTTLVVIENTHTRAGGVVFPLAAAAAVGEVARERGLAMYCDGARLWNAAVATGRSMAELAAPFDLVAVAFSKGLGAPGGSMLAGRRDVMPAVTRYRRMSGGAMRQVGIFAAAASYALDHNLDRLAEDHANARLIGEQLDASAETNMVMVDLPEDGPDAATVVARAKEAGVLLFPFGPRRLRAVTHLDVSRDQCARAADILAAVIHP
jgi:threonine aldolase